MPPSDTKLPLSRPRLIVRVVATSLLTVCAAMVIIGTTHWSARLQGRAFVVYWSWCFVFAVAAILLALADMVLLRRAYRRSRRDLFEQEFMTKDFMEQVRARRKENHDQ